MIAGGGVRAVLELGGIRDVLTKSIGTNNPINQVKATMAGLRGLRKPEDVAELRGLTIRQVLGIPKDEQEDGEGRRREPTPIPYVRRCDRARRRDAEADATPPPRRRPPQGDPARQPRRTTDG